MSREYQLAGLPREIDTLWMLCESGDLTREQFFVAVGIVLGRLERSEESKQISAILSLQGHSTAVLKRYLATKEE